MQDKKSFAIDHMNEHHSDIIVAFCQRYGSFENPTNIKLIGLSAEGMDISCDQGNVFVSFLSRVEDESNGYRSAIIELYNSLDADKKMDKISKSLVEFVDSFKSVIISSVHSDFQCISSYAPFVRENDEIYICLSEVAEHFSSIKQNPDKISLFFIQSEDEAKTILARVRFSVRGEAVFVDDKNLRDEIFNKMQERFPNDVAFGQIRQMKDFHIVKIKLAKGRFVKGFGAAYDSDALTLLNQADIKNPHVK